MTATTQSLNTDIEDLISIIQSILSTLRPANVTTVINLDSRLDKDIGLDSLARVELLTRIEDHYQISLPERALTEINTPRALFHAILRCRERHTGVSPLRTEDALKHIDTIQLENQDNPLPVKARTLIEVLDWHCRLHPDRSHIHFYQDRGNDPALSYGELKSKALKLASALLNLGVQAEDPIALMLPTSEDYFVCFFAILLAGGCPVPMYPPGSRNQIGEHLKRHESILKNCDTAILITLEEAKPFATLLRSSLPKLEHIITPEDLATPTSLRTHYTPSSEDIAFLQYTSGSTGNPKGVMLTHANLLANVRAMGQACQVNNQDVFVSWLPLYHDMGLIGAWFGSLYHGLPLVIMSPLSFISRPQRWLNAIHRYGGTLSAAPNFAYELCMRRLSTKDLKDLDLSSWRAAFNGAEPVNPQTLERFCEFLAPYRFKRSTMKPVYGLAENAVGLAFPPMEREPLIDHIDRQHLMRNGVAQPPVEDQPAQAVPACGQPLPGHEIRVVDAQGQEVPDRHEGRVQFRGPSSTHGYFRNQQATETLFDQNWLNTGDRGYIAKGDLYITGRSKEMIIRAGRNIYPQELESAVAQLEGIRKGGVAVIGSRDTTNNTERLVVIAESRKKDPDAIDTLKQAINGLTTELTGDPADDIVIAPPNTVLKTSSGKIRRASIRDLYDSNRLLHHHKASWLQIAEFTFSHFNANVKKNLRHFGQRAYAYYAWLMIIFFSLPLAAIIAVLPGRERRHKVVRTTLNMLRQACAIPCYIKHAERLPKRGENVIYVANHASYLDSFILLASLPGQFSFIAKGELKNNALAYFLLKRLGVEFVERFDAEKGVADAKRIDGLIQSGRSVFYFPEGTFTRAPGLLSFHMGAFVSAAETNTPIIPIALRGTRSILRAETWKPRRGTVSLWVGESLKTSNDDKKTKWENASALRDQARAFILEHCGEPDAASEENPLQKTTT